MQTLPAPLLALCLSLSVSLVEAADLVIPANQEHTITETTTEVNTFVMEENATLRFAPGITHWQLTAQQASFAKGSSIMARGKDGHIVSSSASKNPVQQPKAAACQPGTDGIDGESGRQGQAGISITLEMGIISFQGLTIDSRGGKGGTGSSGGQGGRGGKSDDCHGADGGRGGNAGAGGNGGRGGDINIRYWSAADQAYIPISNYGPGIRLLTQGGAAGLSGKPGQGGLGGKGSYEKRGTGRKIYRNEGSMGQSGIRAKPGQTGTEGQFLVQPISPPAPAAQ